LAWFKIFPVLQKSLNKKQLDSAKKIGLVLNFNPVLQKSLIKS
jgi:hypothetical protein